MENELSLNKDKRMWSARSKHFTEVLCMQRSSFFNILDQYPEEEETINKTLINVVWYVWNEIGHYSFEWAQKWRVVGNVLRRLEKLATFKQN